MKLLMAANWKMYKTRSEATACLQELRTKIAVLPADREVLVCTPFTCLDAAREALAGQASISLGGENCYPAKEGAFTGEISPGMLLDAGCRWVLAGHSERRAILGESDAFVGEKTVFSLQAGLNVVLCVGETLQERDSGKLEEILSRQLDAGLAGVPADIAPDCLAVAYEPIWAIGTGRVAGPKEILEAHVMVRRALLKHFPEQGKEMRILYGGSVKPENAGEIILLDNVNGVLVGGASLQAESFHRIVLA